MQQLLTKLSEHNYIEWHRTSGDTVTDLFWTHPVNIEILCAFPHVLIMDCTYKTNRYRFPLLQIVGVTSTNMTFFVAYVYMNAEKEDNYTWALTALSSLLDDNCLPSVIVTDRELSLMNSITSIFPKARHLLCRWMHPPCFTGNRQPVWKPSVGGWRCPFWIFFTRIRGTGVCGGFKNRSGLYSLSADSAKTSGEI